jgi:kinesin family protein C2/C3
LQVLNLSNLDFQGGSSSKVVDCILCLKGYYGWKLAGGVGVWRYGGTVRITSLPKGSPSSILSSTESADESVDESESSTYEQLLEFLHLSSEVSIEESRTANALAFLFDHFGLGLLQAYLRESDGIEDFPLNAMVGKTLSILLYHCTIAPLPVIIWISPDIFLSLISCSTQTLKLQD